MIESALIMLVLLISAAAVSGVEIRLRPRAAISGEDICLGDVAEIKAEQLETQKRLEVIIVGGGVGGLEVAKGLRDAPVNVFLVDRHNYYLFQALLYQVATAVLSEEDIAIPIRNVLRDQKNASVALAELRGADLEGKILVIKSAAALARLADSIH